MSTIQQVEADVTKALHQSRKERKHTEVDIKKRIDTLTEKERKLNAYKLQLKQEREDLEKKMEAVTDEIYETKCELLLIKVQLERQSKM